MPEPSSVGFDHKTTSRGEYSLDQGEAHNTANRMDAPISVPSLQAGKRPLSTSCFQSGEHLSTNTPMILTDQVELAAFAAVKGEQKEGVIENRLPAKLYDYPRRDFGG